MAAQSGIRLHILCLCGLSCRLLTGSRLFWAGLGSRSTHIQNIWRVWPSCLATGDWPTFPKLGIDFDVGLNGPLFPLIWVAGVCSLLGEFETGNCFHIELFWSPPALALCTALPSKFVQTCISFVYGSPFQVCADLPTTVQRFRASVFVSLCWCWLGRKASLICSDLLPPSQWSIREIRHAGTVHGFCGLVWMAPTSDLVNWASAVVVSCDCYSGLRLAELSGALIQFGACVDPFIGFWIELVPLLTVRLWSFTLSSISLPFQFMSGNELSLCWYLLYL